METAEGLISKEFIQESEWRYVPKHEKISDYMSQTNFDNKKLLNEKNDLTHEHSMLKFSPKDIKYIFVKNDKDIQEIINFIQTEMDRYPAADVKVLISRVTSLESISQDM